VSGYTLFQTSYSGNCYKVRLLAAMAGIPLTLEEIDILKGESRTDAFLARSRVGKVPLLALPDGRFLAESNAILAYLAEGTPFLPEDRFLRAQAFQWLFFEQYSHEPYIAVARFWLHYKPGGRAERAADIPTWHAKGYEALAVMDEHLGRQPFFVGTSCSIADVALFAYTHVAHEGDFDLAPYGHIGAWLDRIAHQPGFIPITA
jgi:glutathione S-transferase